jgi:hypothetical protein
MFLSLWQTLVRSDKRQARARRRPARRATDLFRRRPLLERLEDRTLFAASLSLPTNVPGPYNTDVTVPVTINQLDDGHGATGLSRVDLDIAYDKTALSVNPTTGVTLGSLLPSNHWFLSYGIVSSSKFPGQNELQILVNADQNLTTTAGGTVVNITFHVNSPGGAPGLYPLNLANDGSVTVTDAYGANGQQYVLNPPPTDASNDAGVDGSINVGGSNPQVMFALSAPSPATAGNAFNFTVTAEYSDGSPDPLYNGTAHFTSTDPQAVLPPNTTFTAGTSTLTLSATLKTAGAQTLTAADTADSKITGTSNSIQVSPAAATHFAVVAPSSVTAGTAFNFTVTALDAFLNTATGYTGTVHFSTVDSRGTLPGNYTFTTGSGGDNGVHTFSATFTLATTETITVADTGPASIKGTSNTIQVNPGPVSMLRVGGPANPIAGAGYTYLVVAEDQYGNQVRSYAGTVHLTSSDTRATLQGDYTFVPADGGAHNLAVTFRTVGGQTVTATDTSNSKITGTVQIYDNPATFLLSAPAGVTAGSAFNFTMTVKDFFGNVATSYTGTVHFTSSDGQAVLPADYTFTSADAGAHTFSATLKSAGNQTITVTDTATPQSTGTSAAITVSPAAVAKFGVFGSASETAGVATTYDVVIAEDQFGNQVRTYTGTVHLTSSDPKAVLPADYTFTTGSGGDNGQHNLPVIFRTVGAQTVTVTDTAHSSVTGTRSVTVNPVTFAFSTPSVATAGAAFNFTVTVKNIANATAAGYTGTVHFTSSDSQAALPADYTFTIGTGGDNGVHTFSATLKTVGSQTITATDTFTLQSTGTSNAIVVNGSAQFLKTDTTTQGTWQGAYGGDGYNVIDGGAPSYPSYATVTPAGNSDYTWVASTPDPRALQKPPTPADRVAAAWYSTGTFTVDVNLTGGAHQVALYLLDWDNNGRGERIDVLDPVTGAVLDSRTAGGFSGGEYFVWSVGGHVTFRLTNLAGNNAVLSGLFFGLAGSPPAGGGSAQFVKTDTATQGYWQGAYGGDGFNVVAAGTPSYPAYATVTTAGNSQYTWADPTPDSRALQKPANPADRLAAAWYSTTSFTVDVNITDKAAHQVAVYLLDWDNIGRSERIDVLDAASGKVLDSRTVAGFSGGEYLVWTLGGHVQLRLTDLAGNNAVLNGLFFGPAGSAPSGNGSAQFVKTDTGPRGTWQGHYGANGYNVVGAGTPSYPSYATVTTAGNSEYTWADPAPTVDPRALQKPPPSNDHIAAAWYSTTSFTVDVNITDGATHQVALYLLDWDFNGRTERIDVLDAASGKVLDSQTVNGFSGGEYLVWDVGGDVAFRLTRQAGNNAVLSGLFFDPVA